MTRLKNHQIYLLLLPAILIFSFVMIFPALMATFLSFFKTHGIIIDKFVGFQNYWTLIHDAYFWSAFWNNIYIILLCLVGQVGLGLVIALLLYSKSLRFRQFHRNAVFVPVVIAPVVVGLIWSIIYKQDGLLNGVLNTLGLGSLIRLWLDDPSIAMTSVTIPLIWQSVGFYAVIFMAALSSIPGECLECAEIDGANSFKRLIYVTLPLIRGTIFTCVVLAVAGNMKLFDHIYVMTKGGPGRATNVLALYAYQNMFKLNKMDYGCTISVGIMVISLLLILGIKRLFRSDSDG